MKAFRFAPDPQAVVRLSGIVPAARPLMVADELRALQTTASTPAAAAIICPSLTTARELAATVPLFLNFGQTEENAAWAVALLPPPPPPDDPDDPMPERLREELECDRLAALTELALRAESGHAPLVVFTTADGLLAPAPPKARVESAECRLAVGAVVDFNALRERIATELDYDFEAVCERPGQFALRGGIIDIYPLNADAPVRLDFFGDELEAIRRFDPTTQLSLSPLQEVIIHARSSMENSSMDPQAIFDYLPQQMAWMWIEPSQIATASPDLFASFERIKDPRVTFQALARNRAGMADRWLLLQEHPIDPIAFSDSLPFTELACSSLESIRRQPLESVIGIERLEEEELARMEFIQQLRQWVKLQGGSLLCAFSSSGKEDEIRQLLHNEGIHDLIWTRLPGDLPEGFMIEAIPLGRLQWLGSDLRSPLLLVTEREWLGRHGSRRPSRRQRLLPQRTRVDGLLDFAELVDGDYLVHLGNGICRYRGIEMTERRGREEEVILLEFADQIQLHLPLSEAHLLTRYVGLSHSHPKLGKLGSGSWEKTRAAAERATLDLAADMLKLQAQRSSGGGHAFPPDTPWQKAFENAFPFTETRDQARAIDEAKQDMEAAKPMDRLLCGDVGFGKTEIAIRAAFKAVMDGRQVAIMVPTTVLAQQHYETFRERFAAYPISVEMLSRFRSSAQQKAIISELVDGRLDVVIGTHRLLSRDVQFARLGLLVIDEEHRFGVRHKEQLKRLKLDVDVLSMSATPIPRTLYLALMGARDLSVIETPPADRLPIETLVRSYDPHLVQKAIQRELDRGGQVFYLHNRVQTIDSVARMIRQLVPQASVSVGHGQMSEDTLERVMTQFVAGETNVLVCTTIIENGLDIPNCNTIIIEGADRFGLSQLYQLRGRVGRFTRQAYAYLLLHRHAQMLDLAHKRLSALRQHNQLGAGFRIAMRDLELRGAGNLLGPQQSGHIAGVGFDLYCQLLRQSIQRLKGEPGAAHIRARVSIDFIDNHLKSSTREASGDIGMGALVDAELAPTRIPSVVAELPEVYIPEARLRIDFYRQLAMAESLDAVNAIEAAMSDRFGRMPKPVTRLLALTRIRVRAELAGIQFVATEGNRLKCQKAAAKRGEFVQLAGRFPRLTGKSPHLRLREIEQFLARQRP